MCPPPPPEYRRLTSHRSSTIARNRSIWTLLQLNGSRNGPSAAYHRESSYRPPLEYITDGRLLTFSDQEGGTLGGGDPTRHSTLRGSKAKETETLSSERSSARSERTILNAEKLTETALRSKVEQAEVAGDVTNSESASRDQGIKTALEKTLATAALAWVASDITEDRAPESKNPASSQSLTDVGTLSAPESIRTSGGDSSRPISVSDEKRPRLSTPKPTGNESLRELSSQGATDSRNADGSRPTANGSSDSQLYSSDAPSVHVNVDVSSSHEVQQEISSSESGTSHWQKYVCVVCSGDFMADRLSLACAWINSLVG